MTNCDIRIWHTLAEVELFVFLFVIKLFLNCCCSIDVLYSNRNCSTISRYTHFLNITNDMI